MTRIVVIVLAFVVYYNSTQITALTGTVELLCAHVISDEAAAALSNSEIVFQNKCANR